MKKSKPVKFANGTRARSADVDRLALAMAFRRLVMRQRAEEVKEGAAAEARTDARHYCAMARREGTGRLAKARIEGCRRNPSPVAVSLLASVAENGKVPAVQRVEAADLILEWGYPAKA